MRLAAQTAKNLKRRRNKLMKVWQPEFVLLSQKIFTHHGQAARNLSRDDLLQLLEKKGHLCVQSYRWSSFF